MWQYCNSMLTQKSEDNIKMECKETRKVVECTGFIWLLRICSLSVAGNYAHVSEPRGPQNAGNSLNRCRAISISWTAKLRAGTCHPTQQALCLVACTNVPRNTQHNKTQQNTISEPYHAQISLRFSLSYKLDQPIFYYCRFRSDECASVTQFRTNPFESFFVNFITA